MSKRNDTTIGISGTRRDKLNEAIVKLVIAKQEPVRMSEIVHFLIDNYLEEAVKDLLHKEHA